MLLNVSSFINKKCLMGIALPLMRSYFAKSALTESLLDFKRSSVYKVLQAVIGSELEGHLQGHKEVLPIMLCM